MAKAYNQGHRALDDGKAAIKNKKYDDAGFTPAEAEKVMYLNAKRLFGI